jgi:hypothetical protein
MRKFLALPLLLAACGSSGELDRYTFVAKVPSDQLLGNGDLMVIAAGGTEVVEVEHIDAIGNTPLTSAFTASITGSTAITASAAPPNVTLHASAAGSGTLQVRSATALYDEIVVTSKTVASIALRPVTLATILQVNYGSPALELWPNAAPPRLFVVLTSSDGARLIDEGMTFTNGAPVAWDSFTINGPTTVTATTSSGTAQSFPITTASQVTRIAVYPGIAAGDNQQVCFAAFDNNAMVLGAPWRITTGAVDLSPTDTNIPCVSVSRAGGMVTAEVTGQTSQTFSVPPV